MFGAIIQDTRLIPRALNFGGQRQEVAEAVDSERIRMTEMASALPEHVARDAIASAFDGSGQAGTSLKLLCLADSIAEPTLELITGAIEELTLGDPLDFATDLGPLIDEDARAKVDSDLQLLIGNGRLLQSIAVPQSLEKGVFYGPHLFEVTSPSAVAKDISGPLLHVLRFSPNDLTGLCETLAANHPDLGLGVHSRIRATLELARRHIPNVALDLACL